MVSFMMILTLKANTGLWIAGQFSPPEFVRMKTCCLLINLNILLLGFNPVNYNNYPMLISM